jgi:hypothetical protein
MYTHVHVNMLVAEGITHEIIVSKHTSVYSSAIQIVRVVFFMVCNGVETKKNDANGMRGRV